MLYAILSDIHANAAALRAALVDAQDLGAEKIICLGDVLGYGPDPVEALEEVYKRVHVCLAGNHDDAVCGRCTTEDFNAFAAAAVARQRRTLKADALAWLKGLPHVCAFAGFACAHGDFSAPEDFNYILSAEEAEGSFAVRPEDLLFVGHTHQPGVFVRDPAGGVSRAEPVDFVLEEGYRYIVNVGSVGYPRSGACRSVYCLYDDTARSVYFRSLPFDLEGYRAKMGGKGLDEAPWMTARAHERAVPLVRQAAHFAAAGASAGPRRIKVAARAARETPVTVRETKRKHAVLLPVFLVMLLAGGVGAFVAWRAGRAGVSPAAAVTPPPAVSPPAVLPPPKAPERPAAPAAAPAAVQTPKVSSARPVAITRPAAEVQADVLTNAVLPLAAEDRKVYFVVELAPKSHPVKARLVFRDAARRILAGSDVVYPPFDRKLARGKKGEKVPEGAARAELEVSCTGPYWSRIMHFAFSTEEIKGGKRR